MPEIIENNYASHNKYYSAHESFVPLRYVTSGK